jgi:rare lipoprotein A
MTKMQLTALLGAAAALAAVALGGCAAPRVREEPANWREEGIASWYGAEFHGRRTANGERYDMYAMTAAHKTLPLGTPVTVTHRETGRRIRVRINDRGPFVAGRIIDLSYAAALALHTAEAGVAPVLVEAHLPAAAFAQARTTAAAPGAAPSSRPGPSLRGAFSVQIGSFAVEGNARRLAARYDRPATPARVVVYEDNRGKWWRVRLGGYADEFEADAAAAAFVELGLAAFVVRED